MLPLLEPLRLTAMLLHQPYSFNSAAVAGTGGQGANSDDKKHPLQHRCQRFVSAIKQTNSPKPCSFTSPRHSSIVNNSNTCSFFTNASAVVVSLPLARGGCPGAGVTSSVASCRLFSRVRADTKFSNRTKNDHTSFSAACLGVSAGSGLTMNKSGSGMLAACLAWSPAVQGHIISCCSP